MSNKGKGKEKYHMKGNVACKGSKQSNHVPFQCTRPWLPLGALWKAEYLNWLVDCSVRTSGSYRDHEVVCTEQMDGWSRRWMPRFPGAVLYQEGGVRGWACGSWFGDPETRWSAPIIICVSRREERILSPQRLMPGGGKSANLGYKDQRAVSYLLFRVISHGSWLLTAQDY